MAEQDDIEDTPNEENEDANETGKFSAIKKLFLNKLVLFSAIGLLVVILLVVSYFVFFASDDEVKVEDKQPTITETAESDTSELELPAMSDAPSIESEIDNQISDALPNEPPSKPKSRVEKIADGVKAGYSKEQELVIEPSNPSSETDIDSENKPVDDELSKLKQQIEAQEQENKQLQQQLEKLNADMKIISSGASSERMGVSVNDILPKSASTDKIPSAPYVILDSVEASDYHSSPYADDELTPEPTWGK